MKLFRPTSTEIQVSGIGTVQIIISRKARLVRISLRPFQDVRITIPWGMSLRRAERVIKQKSEWIKKTRCKISAMEAARREIERKSPQMADSDAKLILSARLKELADLHGFVYQKVAFRTQKTRWGSCSAKNNISLNLQLALLPRKLIDYVLLHELLHTRIKNHSPEFWRELEKYISRPRLLRAELNRIALN